MVNRIQKLPKEVIERISAGEVIERPVSIFKELVENSLDANAQTISIKIYKGGKEKIIVEDDGDGIFFEDMPNLFIRFSTSKIKMLEDIERISSFGFRGEALSSIAAVSHITIISKPKTATTGGIISSLFGNTQPPKPINCDYGTQITVENIFDNFPARKKFLKSADVECAHIINWFKAFAIANPTVDFYLTKDAQPYYIIKKTTSITERIQSIYGKELINNLEFISFNDGDFNATLYFIRNPNINFESFNYIFVNRRYIKSNQLAYIIRQATTGFLSTESKFSYILFIEIDPTQIDLNVHPAKIEIKFKNLSNICDALVRNLRGYLEKNAIAVNLNPITTPTYNFPQQQLPPQTTKTENSSETPISTEQKTFFKPNAEVIIQLANSYILVENQDHIAIYDQHALSERILLTRLINNILNKNVKVQHFTIPIFCELDSEIIQWLKEKEKLWKECGFEYTIESPTKLKITALPAEFSSLALADLKDCFEKAFISSSKEIDKKEVYYHLLKQFACKNAIKQGEHLERTQMAELVNIAEKEGLYTCIHGRPVKLTLTYDTLYKFFQRT
jgi:DNA mismatch repair protein MutL